MAASDLIAHAVLDGEWLGWLLLTGVLITCWVPAVLAIAALFAGPVHTAETHVTPGLDQSGASVNAPAAGGRRRV